MAGWLRLLFLVATILIRFGRGRNAFRNQRQLSTPSKHSTPTARRIQEHRRLAPQTRCVALRHVQSPMEHAKS